MTTTFDLFATCPKGMEGLLADELRSLGAEGIRPGSAGVGFRGSLSIAYRACLWSRLASRVLLPLARFSAAAPQALYDGVKAIDWSAHLAPTGTLAVDLDSSDSAITHSHFGALKTKDAVVDQFRERFDCRPSIDTHRPDVRIYVRLFRDKATVGLNLAGESLHRRGYRTQAGEAPLKENLAAAMLIEAGWPEIARNGGSFVDPMCGSGTLPIEAALMAADIAPGLNREYFGFLGWLNHDAALWAELLAEAHLRREEGLKRLPTILGYDQDSRLVQIATANAQRAGLAEQIKFACRSIADAQPAELSPGLLVINPPYGERLGETPTLAPLYAQLGASLRRAYPDWKAGILTSEPSLASLLGMTPAYQHDLYNGPIACQLLCYDLAAKANTEPSHGGANMFADRLNKNLKRLRRWAERNEVSCYRLYDADMPEYNLAVDLYRISASPGSPESLHVHAQEYAAPSSIDVVAAQRRLAEALSVLPQVLKISPEQVHFKVRQRQKDGGQYEKIASAGHYHEVREGPARLLVNLTDYLDTGLFLDHRLTRALVRDLAKGRHFLNLFAYTGAATVHAALGGAVSTTTVDMSVTYLDWAKRNLALNGIEADTADNGREPSQAGNPWGKRLSSRPSPRHELIRADVLRWVEDNQHRRYGLIFLDPPTFSRSKRMTDTFDVQRDHVELINTTARLLEPNGILIFSTNARRFSLDTAALADRVIEDITAASLPEDFARNPRIHRCYRITLRDNGTSHCPVEPIKTDEPIKPDVTPESTSPWPALPPRRKKR